MRNWIDLFEAAVPPVIQRAAAGHWPEVLHGEEITQMVTYIEWMDYMSSPADFHTYYEDAVEDGTWDHLSEYSVAHLRVLPIGDIDLPEHGAADPDVVAQYATLTSKAPPVLVVGNELQDGNHRVEAAQKRGETHILAYVVS